VNINPILSPKLLVFLLVVFTLTELEFANATHAPPFLYQNDYTENEMVTPFSGNLLRGATLDSSDSTSKYLYITENPSSLHRINIDDLNDITTYTVAETLDIDDIAFDSVGNLYVSARENQNILFFSKTSFDIKDFSSPGTVIQNSTLNIPQIPLLPAKVVDIHYMEPYLYLYAEDYSYYRYDSSDPSAELVKIYEAENLYTLNGAFAEYDGMLYLMDKAASKIIKYDPNSQVSSVFVDFNDPATYGSETPVDLGIAIRDISINKHGFMVVLGTFAQKVILDTATKIIQDNPLTGFSNYNNELLYDSIRDIFYIVKALVSPNLYTIEFSTINPAYDSHEKKKNGGGCSDCTPPTFGLNKKHTIVVEDGFTYNGNTTDVINYHTDFPLITVVTNQTNTATLKIFENRGVNNIKLVQFGMGMPGVGSPLNDAQTLVEVWLEGTDIDKIVKIDKNNLVDIINATISTVDCMVGDVRDCLEVTIQYIYRDKPKYNIMAINAIDIPGNSQTNYINDGILVTGDSLNEPLEEHVVVSKGGALYPQRAGTVLLTLVDYKTDIWQDEYGYMWSTNQYGPFILDTIPVPQKEPDVFLP